MSDIERLVSDIAARRPDDALYHDYYAGHQPIEFAGEKLQTTFGEALSSLSCNRCGNVVDAFGDRLQILGFADRENGTANKDADEVWDENNGAKIAGEVHQEALTAGDGFLIVFPNRDGRARLYVQDAANVAVVYDDDDPGVVTVAAKLWRRFDGSHRLNLYYPDRLEKYAAPANGTGRVNVSTDVDQEVGALANDAAWQEFMDDGDTSWPIPYDGAWAGTVPVFHFPNNGRRGRYGRSELADIIPLQDRLNMTLANTAIAEEFQSFRQRWATGVQPILDPDTKQPISPFKNGPGMLWMTAAKEAVFGDFSETNLTQFDTNAEGWERRIARTAKVPLHYVVQTGTPPSGESLKTAEAPFVSKVKDRQIAWGEVWERVMEFALAVNGVAGASIRVNWQSAETRDETAFWQNAVIKRDMGVSERRVLSEAGYTDDDIDTMRAEKAEEDALSLETAQKALGAGAGFPQKPGQPVDQAA